MKLLAITFKDITRSLRSVFALAFMFGVPLLVTPVATPIAIARLTGISR